MTRTLIRIFSYAKPYIVFFVLTIVFAAVGVSLSLTVPVFIGKAVDCCVGKGQVDFKELGTIAVTLGIMVVLSGLFQWLMSLCTNKLAFLTVRDLRSDVFAKLEKVPLKFIDGSTKGELTSRIINEFRMDFCKVLHNFSAAL